MKLTDEYKLLKEILGSVYAHRIRTVKVGSIELTLDPQVEPPASIETEEVTTLKEHTSMPSDEDLLFWSAGGDLPSEALIAQAKEDEDPTR